MELSSNLSQKVEGQNYRARIIWNVTNVARKSTSQRSVDSKKGGQNTLESWKPQGNIIDTNTSDDKSLLFSEATTSSKERKQFADIWLLDLEASWHMTSNRDFFPTYEYFLKGLCPWVMVIS